MMGTIVSEPLSAHGVLLAKPARMRVAYLPQQVLGSSLDQGNRFPLVRVSTGIRAAMWIKSGSFRFSVDWARANLSRSLLRRSFGVCVLPVLNDRLFESGVCP